MTARKGNVAVKKGSDNGREGRMPMAAFQSPMAGLRGEFERALSRFFPEGWPHMGMTSLMDLDPFRTVGTSAFENVLQGTRADVSESDTEYEISVELPGVDEKDIELDVSDGMLMMSAEKREEREEKKKNYHLSERSYGMVKRGFRVPEGVDVSKIKAGFSKGVLRVTLPKTREAKAKQRRIPVNES